MKNETEYNTDHTKIRHNNYVRNSRAIVAVWAIFCCIYLILNIVVFAQPQWIGDSGDSAVAGFFGIWEYCNEASVGNEFVCSGDFLQWDSFPNSYYRACAIMVGVSCILFMLVIFCFLLFCLMNTATVLRICACFQILSGLLMMVTLIVYPGGWDNSYVKAVCGLQSGRYKIGICEMRWAYALSIVLVFDAFILAILALVLAAKQANLLPEVYKKEKDKLNSTSSDTTSKASQSKAYANYYNDIYLSSSYPSNRGINYAFVLDY